MQLRPVQQVPVGCRQDADLRLGTGARLADGNVALGNDQCAEHTVEVIDAGLRQKRQLVGLLRVLRIIRRDLEQQIEIIVARPQAAVHRAE